MLVAGPEQAAGDDTLDETVSLNAEFYTRDNVVYFQIFANDKGTIFKTCAFNK